MISKWKIGYNLEKAEQIKQIIQKYEIGQVHVQQFDCISSVFPACIETNTPYVAFVHTGIRGVYEWFEKCFIGYDSIFEIFFNMAEKIVAITESAKEENMKHYNIKDDGKYIVINNSIKFDRRLKQNNNIPHNITNFLIVSRFGNEKLTSIRNAIKIFKEYNKKHKESKLTLVGGGEYENEVKKELEDIKEYTNFLGARNNVLDIMLDNDIVIGLDRCILEAIATKRIAVISGYENITEIVTKDNIEVASGENFSGRGLKEKTVNEIVQELEQLKSKQIEKIVSTNFEYIYKNLNCEKNIYVLREAKKVNTDSKIWYSNIVKLINEIVISKETNDKIWKAKLYLEEQNENKDKVIKKELPELLNEKSRLINEVNELKKRNDDLAEVISNFESGYLYKISKKILNLKKRF